MQPQKFNPFVTKSDGEENIGKIVGWKCDRIPKDISILNDRPHPPTLQTHQKPPYRKLSSNSDIRFNTDPPNLSNIKIP
ncbi:MAG: hypothetical protein JGK17_23540 [Microcoleus sp. PH2017_10_PVI_O_A]|uniref:hypothetical protein n=1 Tax=unclassified Microcoleus TaxID=2642155 RepID=UPI001DD493CB|nr:MULTISPECIES: hypothetical protein [unclassified Microcoleus]MCC3408502.1 hypothetical protein [Microcoleus sp. PH2017_10_PVI_O_A]MCC3481051.1 hypothetical protein [Microcoleus sp. PH2017_12_PCY_D_A]